MIYIIYMTQFVFRVSQHESDSLPTDVWVYNSVPLLKS